MYGSNGISISIGSSWEGPDEAGAQRLSGGGDGSRWERARAREREREKGHDVV